MNTLFTGTSGLQAANKGNVWYDSCRALTQRPRNLPKVAPIAIEGINIPAGT